MAYEDYRRRMENLRHLIKHERTGDPAEFAKKLKISRRTLFHYLEILRDEGSKIKFNRNQKTYYYHEY